MAKKIAPNTLASRASQMPLKTITDEEFLYGEVWKLHQEAPDSQALPSLKLPVTDAMHFGDRVAESLASNSLRPTSLEGGADQASVDEKLAGEFMHHSKEISLTSMPSLQITLTGQGVALDESRGLQNAITSPTVGDQDDNDAALALLPAVFSERLADLSSHTPMEAAWSGYDGVTGHHVLSVPVATTGYDLGFSNALGHALSGEDSGLRTLQGETIYLYTDSANNNIVLGKTNADVIVFSAYLQEINSSSNDVDLWTVLYQPLAHPDHLLPDESINLLNKIYVSVSTGGVDNLKDATSGQHLFIMAGNSSEAFVVTGLHPANQSAGVKPHSGDSVNISHAGEVTSVGTNNQMVDPPTYDKNGHVLKSAEGLTLTFVSGAQENYTGANLSPTEADVESNIQFTGLIETHFARFVVSQLQPSKACTLKISALHTQLESGAQFVDGLITGDTSVAVNRVRIVDHNGTLLEDTRDSVDSPQITVQFESGSAIVSGVKQGDQIEYFSESGHNRTVIMNVGSDQADFNASFDIGDFSIHHFESSTVEIGSKISFEDSAPETSGNPGIQLDDDALVGGNPGGIGDVAPDSANVTGTLAHSFGADGGSLAWLPEGAPAGFAYELGEGGALLVKQGESTVLTLSLNTATGDYSVVQGAPIHHMPGADENTQEFTLSYQVSDGDGDTTDGRLLIQVNDDTPTVAENLVIHLDDDALTGGLEGGIGDTAPDLQNVTGTLSHSYGADGPGQVAWQLEGAPVGFSYEQSGQDLLIKQADVLVITLTVDPVTGEYSTVQNAPIVNEPGLNENNQDFAVGYSVTDSDGDTVHGWLNITVNDDTPHGSFNEINLLDDDALPNGNPGGVGDISPDTAYATGNLDYGYGADGGSIAWLTTGAPAGFTYEASGTSLLVKQGGATVLTLTLDAETAAYTVIQNQAIQHAPDLDENTQQFNVAYRVTDADGDSADGEFLISVNDDTPTVAENLVIHLDDDALTGGLEGGIGDTAPDLQNVTGTLSHSYGADGPGQVAWQLEGAPVGFSYEQSGQDLLIKQADVLVITLTVDPVTGEYSTVQNAPIVNEPGLNENNQDFAVGYSVTDSDGDTVHGWLNITVNDDTPHGSFNEINLLDDDALPNGNPGGVGDIRPDTAYATGNLDYGYGADGGSIAWLTTGAPAGFTYEASGTSLLVKQGGATVLTLTLDAETVAYTVIQNQAIQHAPGLDENTQQFNVAYRVTDADGDSADGEFLISVNDDTPTVAENPVIHLDDDALTGGLEGGIGDTAPDLQNVTGTLSHSYGADGPGQVAWQLEGAPVGFSYEQSGQDLLIKQADVLVITLTVDPVTGEYSTVQNAPIVNEPGLNENNQDFAVGYSVTDSDGDTVHGRVNITVNDDTPHGSFNEINLLDDDALPNGNPGGVGDISPDTAYATGNLDYGYGADGGSIAWLTTGAPAGFTYEASGTSLLVKQGGATVLTLTLDAESAAYTVIQNQAIQHAPGLDENTQQFNVAYRVTDADGDSADGEFFISVNDDSPTVGSNSLVLLDDDALSRGNAGGMGDVSPDNQNTTGILAHSFGADGGSIAWRSEGAPTGFAYEVSGNQLWVKQGSETVLTLTMVSETGLYVVEQNAAVRHLGDMQENDQLFSVGYEVTDGDGDIAQGELVISVNDDSPVVLAISDAIYANTDNPAPGGNGIFVYSVGADQRSDFSASDSDFAMFSLVGQVGVNSITSSVVSWQSETSHDLTFDFEFDYQPNPSSILTAHATGILSFHKDLGTYSVALSQPLDGMEILTTSRALSFTGYELESSVIDHTQPHVSVAKLSEQMYAQFTAVSEPGSGSGSNNLQATGSDANNSNYASGEIFTQVHDWVSTSNLSNGVGGDTLQKGEVLDFDLFTSNPMGHTDAIPTASATALFLKFDGISSEDLVVVLKLSDMTTHAQTTRALVIDGSDILRRGNTLSSAYQIVLDNNDGAVIIEQNDYNGNGENYVITGAQVLTSTEGVTGQGIDFNSVTGPAGGSTATQNFGAETTDNDVIKISDIGVVTQSTSTLDSHLDFSFAVLDGDGDASATQHLSVLIAGSASSLLDSLNG